MARNIFLKKENLTIEGLVLLFAFLVLALGMRQWLENWNTNDTEATLEQQSPDVLGTSSKIYYLDAISGSDSNNGTAMATPFKTISRLTSVTFLPGDQILFRAGQTHATATSLTVFANGTAGAPIVISSYGSGDKPKLQTTDAGQYDGVINLVGNYWHVNGLHLTTPSGMKTEAAIRMKGQYHLVENCEISLTGHGIEILNSSNHTVRQNYIHDLQMIRNDTLPDNDAGAAGIVVGDSSNVEIYGNQFVNLQPLSYDYGRDGSALETYDNASNVFFYRNYVENVDNFSEIGGSSSSKLATNIVYHNNVIVNPRGGIYFHLAGTETNFGLQINNVRFEQNTVYRDRSDANSSFFIGFSGAPATGVLSLKNNLFHIANLGNFYYNLGQATHEYNLYKLTNVSNLGFTAADSEIFGSPVFVDVAARNFSLQAGSAGIDQGAKLNYDHDYLGQLRLAGTKMDIGAYEYQAAVHSSSASSTATTSSTSSAPACKADYDNDGKVNVTDLSLFAKNYQKTGINCSLDLAGADCLLTSADLSVFGTEYKLCGY
jgi:parallel beta-helix repeat protein